MKIKISKIPTLPADVFLPELSYQRTEIYFYAKIIDGVLDTGYLLGWKPVGKSSETRLLSGNNNLAIIFENEKGERTWFHFFNDAVEQRSQRIGATAPRGGELVEPRARS